MKPARVLPCFLVPILSLFFLSCSDDDGPGGPGGGSDPEIAAASSMVYEVALPLLRDLFLRSYVANPFLDIPDAKGACTTIGDCSSGSGEFCVEMNTVQLSFVQCMIGQNTLDGTVTLDREGNAGAGRVSLTIGDIGIEGDISYEESEGCFDQFFTNFVITTSTRTITMNGAAGWCEPYETVGETTIPSYANFEFVVPSLSRLIDFLLLSDPVGEVEVLVMSPDRSKTYRVCHGELIGGSLSCTAGPDA